MLLSVRPLLDPPGMLDAWMRVRSGVLGVRGGTRGTQCAPLVSGPYVRDETMLFLSLFSIGDWLPFSIFPDTPVLSSRYLLAIYFSVFCFWFLFFLCQTGHVPRW